MDFNPKHIQHPRATASVLTSIELTYIANIPAVACCC